MTNPKTETVLMQKGQELAQSCVEVGVLENQLALVLVHLKRHRSCQATLELLEQLPTSHFSRRSNETPGQLRNLKSKVKSALEKISDWQEAAQIVGWGKRLYSFYDRF